MIQGSTQVIASKVIRSAGKYLPGSGLVTQKFITAAGIVQHGFRVDDAALVDMPAAMAQRTATRLFVACVAWRHFLAPA